ncbi:uncharacterized protein UDID_05821 [Ustilago sp. UG-2017a]|nr:uncharacterized protein UDID_05821 [Ustilago sp. UG-2017a]
MAPTLFARAAAVDLESVEGAQGRTRVDDTDPDITFSPSIKPFLKPGSPWVVVKDALAYKGSAISSNSTDTYITFGFSGDSLTLGMLYKATGTSLKLTLENGTSYPFSVSSDEATASAPNRDKEALQKKAFHLDGLTCANHTATLTPVAGESAIPAGQPLMYFDWFSFPTPGNPATCKPSTLLSAAGTGFMSTPSSQAQSAVHDYTTKYAGIGVGVALLGFIAALVVVMLRRRQKRHQAPAADQPDRVYRPKRAQRRDETLNMTLTMSQNSARPVLQPEAVFRPRGIHALNHDGSFSTIHSDTRNDVTDSPSANATFPLMPVSPDNHMVTGDDAGFGIGQALLDLPHDPNPGAHRQIRNSMSRLHYEKARTLSGTPHLRVSPKRGSPGLVGGHALQRMPREDINATTPVSFGRGGSLRAQKASRASPRRPCTASAVDRLRSDARQLDVPRTLSPFDRSRPATSSEMPCRHHKQHLATAQAQSHGQWQRFRRNSSSSIDTRWSRVSVNESSEPPVTRNEDKQEQSQLHVQAKRQSKSLLDLPKAAEEQKTTDSEAEMWVSKRKTLTEFGGKRRRNSTIVPPRRPPKSPHRPSTGQAATSPRSFQPFTIS